MRRRGPALTTPSQRRLATFLCGHQGQLCMMTLLLYTRILCVLSNNLIITSCNVSHNPINFFTPPYYLRVCQPIVLMLGFFFPVAKLIYFALRQTS